LPSSWCSARPELRLVGRADHVVRWSMHGQTDQWSCGFLLDRANRSIVHGSAKGTFQVPRFRPLVLRAFEESREREREVPLWAGTKSGSRTYFPFFPVPKWPDKCQSLPYDETTPVEKGLGNWDAQRANRERVCSCVEDWRLFRLSALLYIYPLYVLVSKILSSILNSPAPIHPLYHPLSTLSTMGPTCHFI
jgi:hypothetical protein